MPNHSEKVKREKGMTQENELRFTFYLVCVDGSRINQSQSTETKNVFLSRFPMSISDRRRQNGIHSVQIGGAESSVQTRFT